ncbi:MAG: protein kinase domain-containing protein [Verrucomicrobiales bacterium]
MTKRTTALDSPVPLPYSRLDLSPPMNSPEPTAPPAPLACHECGATISTIDPLGGGLCEACLWRDLSEPPSGKDSPFRDLVPGHEIIEELGRGGMGVVYRARQRAPAREVALKMLLPLDTAQAELRARFQQEARTLADLEHPAILPLYQVGEVDDRPYFTMKLAVGGTLAQRVGPERPWAPKRAAELTAVLADALHYAHLRGVIHRDLTPGNVLFDEAGRPYLADFGLAKLNDARASFSRSAGVLGTPAYLAPEIASSGARAATTASDIYSLGAALFELLTGRPPFATDGLAALLVKIAQEQPPTPTSLNAHVPRDLEIVCLKCLRKSPTERYATAAEFGDDLRRWIGGEPVLAREFTPVERLAKWARRRPGLASLSGALLATSLGSALWLTHSNRQLNLAVQRAEAAQARADARADFFLGDIADKLESLGRLDLLDSAYENALATELGTDEASRRRRSQLLTRWGHSQIIQLKHEKAAAPLAEAMQLASSLPPTPVNGRVQAEAAMAQATLTAETGSFEDAVAILDAASSRIEASPSLPAPDRHSLLARLAETYVEIGLSTVRSSPELQQQAARAVTHRREAFAELNPGNHQAQMALAAALRIEGETMVRAARRSRSSDTRPLWEAAESRFREAQAYAGHLTQQTPVLPAWKREYALNVGWLADTRLHLASPTPESADAPPIPAPAIAAEVFALHELQIQLLREVVAADPRNVQHLRELSSALGDLAEFARRQGDQHIEDRARTNQATLTSQLHALAPAARSWLFVAMNADLDLGYWQLRKQRPIEAKTHFKRAWESAVQVLARRPQHRADFDGIRKVSEDIANALSGAGDPEAARQFIKDALAFTKQTATSQERQPDTLHWLEAHLHRRLADMAEGENNFKLALLHNLEALERRSEALRRRASQAVADPDAVTNNFLKAETLHLQEGQPTEAVELAEKALRLRRDVADLSLDPNRWAKAIVLAAEAGVKAGGDTALKARRLAAEALSVIYPAAVPNTAPELAPYEPKPEHIERNRKAEIQLIEALKSLAGSETTPAP